MEDHSGATDSAGWLRGGDLGWLDLEDAELRGVWRVVGFVAQGAFGDARTGAA